MNTTATQATITAAAIAITSTVNRYNDRDWTTPITTTATLAAETRPASLADADTMLAFHSYARTGAWDLTPDGGVAAPVTKVGNRFNGTVAARLWGHIGTSHGEFEAAAARTVQDGDLISDSELSALYVVAGSSVEGHTIKIHMVAEGKTRDDRFTGTFSGGQIVRVARRKA